MPVQTDHLADEIKDLTGTVTGLKTEVAGFRGSVETQLAVIKWVGIFFASVIIALVGGAVSIAWNASSLVSEVRQQGGRLEKIEQQLGQLIQRIDQGVAPKPKP